MKLLQIALFLFNIVAISAKAPPNLRTVWTKGIDDLGVPSKSNGEPSYEKRTNYVSDQQSELIDFVDFRTPRDRDADGEISTEQEFQSIMMQKTGKELIKPQNTDRMTRNKDQDASQRTPLSKVYETEFSVVFNKLSWERLQQLLKHIDTFSGPDDTVTPKFYPERISGEAKIQADWEGWLATTKLHSAIEQIVHATKSKSCGEKLWTHIAGESKTIGAGESKTIGPDELADLLVECTKDSGHDMSIDNAKETVSSMEKDERGQINFEELSTIRISKQHRSTQTKPGLERANPVAGQASGAGEAASPPGGQSH